MITVELMMVICFILTSLCMYVIYRYFNDIIDDIYCELKKDLENFSHVCTTKEVMHADTIKDLQKNTNALAEEIKSFRIRLDFIEQALEAQSKKPKRFAKKDDA